MTNLKVMRALAAGLLFTVLVVWEQGIAVASNADNLTPAQQAVANYEQALKSGDQEQIRKAVLSIQSSPEAQRLLHNKPALYESYKNFLELNKKGTRANFNSPPEQVSVRKPKRNQGVGWEPVEPQRSSVAGNQGAGNTGPPPRPDFIDVGTDTWNQIYRDFDKRRDEHFKGPEIDMSTAEREVLNEKLKRRMKPMKTYRPYAQGEKPQVEPGSRWTEINQAANYDAEVHVKDTPKYSERPQFSQAVDPGNRYIHPEVGRSRLKTPSLETRLKEAAFSLQEGVASGKQVRLLRRHNDVINRMATRGEIDHITYQRVQRDFAQFNEAAARQAARNNNLKFQPQQRVITDPGNAFSPGTDSDYILSNPDGKPMRPEQVEEAIRSYNRIMNHRLGTNGVNYARKLNSDFLADPKGMSNKDFMKVASMNKGAYTRKGAAEYEAMVRRGETPPSDLTREFADEMVDKDAQQRRRINKYRQEAAGSGKKSNGRRTSPDPDASAAMQQEMQMQAKYTSRLNMASRRLADQYGLEHPEVSDLPERAGNRSIKPQEGLDEAGIIRRNQIRSSSENAMQDHLMSQSVRGYAEVSAGAATRAQTPRLREQMLNNAADYGVKLSPSEQGRLIKDVGAKYGDDVASALAKKMRMRKSRPGSPGGKPTTQGSGRVIGEVIGGTAAGGVIADTATRKAGNAIDQNRDLTAGDVADMGYEGSGLKWAYEGTHRIAVKNRKEQMGKWATGEQGWGESFVKATVNTITDTLWEVGDHMVVKPVGEIVRENMEERDARAKVEGRRPGVVDEARFFAKSLAESASLFTGGDQIARAYHEPSTWDERGDLAGQRVYMGQYVDRNLNHGKRKINDLQDQLEKVFQTGDPHDAATRARALELLSKYDEEYKRLKNLETMANKTLGDYDPDRVANLRNEVAGITDASSMREYASDMFQQRSGRAITNNVPGHNGREEAGTEAAPAQGGFSEIGDERPETGIADHGGFSELGPDERSSARANDGGFAEMGQDVKLLGVGTGSRDQSGDFAEPGDTETYQVLKKMQEMQRKNGDPALRVHRYFDRLHQEQLERTRRDREEMTGIMNNMVKQLNEVNQQFYRQQAQQAQRARQRDRDRAMARLGLDKDPFGKYRKYAEEGKRRRLEQERRKRALARQRQQQLALRRKSLPPAPPPAPGANQAAPASSVNQGGRSYDECVNQLCPSCAGAVSLLGQSTSKKCNECKKRKAALIKRCMSKPAPASHSSGTQHTGGNTYYRARPRTYERNYYAAKRYQPRFRNYHYVIGKIENGGLAGYQIIYGPKTFEECRRWLKAHGYW